MILSVESINDNSPYKVQYATNKSFVIFKTDYDVHYLVGFEYGIGYSNIGSRHT